MRGKATTQTEKEYAPIVIDVDVHGRLFNALDAINARRGHRSPLGIEDLVRWSVRQIEQSIAACEDSDGSGFCYVHMEREAEPDEVTGDFTCDGADISQFWP